MEPYEDEIRDDTSAKIRRQEEILARVAVFQGEDANDLIDDVFSGSDGEDYYDADYDIDNVIVYQGDGRFGMECDVTDARRRQK